MGANVSKPCLVLWRLEEGSGTLDLILHFVLCFERSFLFSLGIIK